MDAALEIFIPSDSKIKDFNFIVPIFQWQGCEYPQGPPECTFGSNFNLKVLERSNELNIVDLPFLYQQINFKCIEVSGKGLDIYVDSLFGFDFEEPNFTLKNLVIALLSNELTWIIIYSHEYDGYNKIIKGDVQKILSSLEFAIKFSKEGFIVFK